MRSSTTIQQPNHIHAKRERRLDPTAVGGERAWSQLNYCSMRNSQQDGRHTAIPGGSSCNSRDRSKRGKPPHTHRTVTDYKETCKESLPKKEQKPLRQTKPDIHTRSGQPNHNHKRGENRWRLHPATTRDFLQTFRRSIWLRTTENKDVTIPHEQQRRQQNAHSRKEIPSDNEKMI